MAETLDHARTEADEVGSKITQPWQHVLGAAAMLEAAMADPRCAHQVEAWQDWLRAHALLLCATPAGTCADVGEKYRALGVVFTPGCGVGNLMAIELAPAFHTKWPLVDHVTSKMDGIVFMRRLRVLPTYAHVPMVMLTDTRGRASRLAALEAGAIDVLPRSLGSRETAAKLRNLVLLSRALSERCDLDRTLLGKIQLDIRIIFFLQQDFEFDS